jgi:hypothetical protein
MEETNTRLIDFYRSELKREEEKTAHSAGELEKLITAEPLRPDAKTERREAETGRRGECEAKWKRLKLKGPGMKGDATTPNSRPVQ